MNIDWMPSWGTSRQREMPTSFLMIDWTGTTLNVTEVWREGNSVRLGKTFKQAIDVSLQDGRLQASKWLQQLVKRESFRTRQAVVCAPRRYVAFKLLTLPAVDDDRLAEAVHLQCEALFPISTSELVVDFVAQPRTEGQSERAVLVAAIPREQIEVIGECLTEAELQCQSILIPELAVSGPESNGRAETEAIVSLGSAKVEFTIRTQNTPILCYAAKTPAEQSLPAEIVSTLRRLLASVSPTVMGGPLSSIRFLHIAGGTTGSPTQPAWVDLLRRELLMKISYRLVKREEELKAQSLWAALNDPRCCIDFAQPRKPVDHRRRLIRGRLKIATAIAATALLGWGLARLNSQRLDHQIAQLQQQRIELENQINKERPRWQQVSLVAQWQARQVDTGRLLREYIQALPGNEELMLSRLEVIQSSDGSYDLNVEGLAKDSQSVNRLVNDLINSPLYNKTQLKRLEARPGDNRYSAEFAIIVTLSSGANHVEN